MTWVVLHRILWFAVCSALVIHPGYASAQVARITSLNDVNFGTITNLAVDQTDSQNVCLYSTGFSGTYHITATGSGSGGAFTLSSGSSTLAYEVQWADSANQTTGQSLAPGVALTGQTASSFFSTCFFGFFPTASLTTVLRASATSTADAGFYTGTLTLLVAPN